MTKRLGGTAWAKIFQRNMLAMTRRATASGTRALVKALKPKATRQAAEAGAGTRMPGLVVGAGGARRYRLYRPPAMQPAERLPLMVMLHGCGQDADSFAASTRMNRVAARERFLVLYPEQDRLANAQGCWNWFDTKSGRAQAEAALILQAIDQVCLLHGADAHQVAVAGMSAGASMAALLATQHPGRFKALVMHSGIPPGTANSTLTALRAMQGQRRTTPLPATPHAMQDHWPPLLVIHGDADAVVSPRNGLAAVQAWGDAAGASASPARRLQRGQRHPMVVTDLKCQGSTVATLVVVAGLAHAWSGGAANKPYSDPRGPDASRMAWAFAAQQFRR